MKLLPITTAIFFSIFISACSEPVEQVMKIDPENQEIYAGSFIVKANLLLLLGKGRTDDAIAFLEQSIEDDLSTIIDFDDSNMKTVAFYTAGLLDEQSDKTLFNKEDLKNEIGIGKRLASQVLSESCHPTMSCGGGFFCWRLPISPTAVDVTDTTGIWRYIKDSHCGFKLNGNACGEPVTGAVCI